MTLAIGAAAVALVRCAGLPTVAALLSALTLGAILRLGIAAALLGAVAFTATAFLVRKRQRPRCAYRDRQ